MRRSVLRLDFDAELGFAIYQGTELSKKCQLHVEFREPDAGRRWGNRVGCPEFQVDDMWFAGGQRSACDIGHCAPEQEEGSIRQDGTVILEYPHESQRVVAGGIVIVDRAPVKHDPERCVRAIEEGFVEPG